MNPNPTPKQRFVATKPMVERHRDLMQKPEFEAACDFAMMEYQQRLSAMNVTFNDAAANHFKITGALELIAIMRNLGETTPLPTKRIDDNLQHKP